MIEPTDGVELVLASRARDVGGVTVARTLPAMQRRAVGPFVFLDHMGPVDIAPGHGFDVLPHPHIGLSTVTYLFEGEIIHRDSVGSVRTIRPGEVNLMTAGRGVVHSERATPEVHARGGRQHGLQMWLGLPLADEECAPSFEHWDASAFPEVANGGAILRVVFGAAFDQQSPIRHPSSPLLIDVELAASASIVTPAAAHLAIYVVSGEVRIGERTFEEKHLIVLAPNARVTLTATRETRAVLIGGDALDGGPRYLDWNFVSSRKERLERAKGDWQNRLFPAIPSDNEEFVPYPELRGPRP